MNEFYHIVLSQLIRTYQLIQNNIKSKMEISPGWMISANSNIASIKTQFIFLMVLKQTTIVQNYVKIKEGTKY